MTLHRLFNSVGMYVALSIWLQRIGCRNLLELFYFTFKVLLWDDKNTRGISRYLNSSNCDISSAGNAGSSSYRISYYSATNTRSWSRSRWSPWSTFSQGLWIYTRRQRFKDTLCTLSHKRTTTNNQPLSLFFSHITWELTESSIKWQFTARLFKQ